MSLEVVTYYSPYIPLTQPLATILIATAISVPATAGSWRTRTSGAVCQIGCRYEPLVADAFTIDLTRGSVPSIGIEQVMVVFNLIAVSIGLNSQCAGERGSACRRT